MVKRKKDNNLELGNTVALDGDLSDKKIKFLVNYIAREEEGLDFKETYAKTGKECEVDLVCDIVSMANTRGGYIIYGIQDNKDGTFKTVGINPKVQKLLTPEYIMDLLPKYINANVRVNLKLSQVEGHNIIALFTDSSKLPVPFRRVANIGKENKFKEGEIFVRHSAKSERANYDDWLRFNKEIREDERDQFYLGGNTQFALLERLDRIIELMGGESPEVGRLNLSKATEIVVENKFERLLTEKNNLRLKRVVKNEFYFVIKELKEMQSEVSKEVLLEKINREYDKFLNNILPIWNLSIEGENWDAKYLIRDNLIMLYDRISGLKFAPKGIDDLYLQSKVVYLFYCLGALAIHGKRPDYASSLTHQPNAILNTKVDKKLYLDTFYRLRKAERLDNLNLCSNVINEHGDNEYLLTIFNTRDSILEYFCRFDYYQCLVACLYNNEFIPSFGLYYKNKIEPFIGDIIKYRSFKDWFDTEDVELIYNSINHLENMVSRSYGITVYDDNEWFNPDVNFFFKGVRSNIQAREMEGKRKRGEL